MALHEHSDVVQWGMNLFDVDPCYSPGYYGDMIQHHTGDVYDENYFHSHYNSESNQVENDEIIARTLQEEFSQLEIAERSGYSQADEEQFHASQPSYDWHNTPMMNYCSGGHNYVNEGVGDIETSSSCCSPGEVGGCSLELVDNYPFDNEIERRLSEITPIPHIPKINGEIPSIDEATSDHERLLERLQLYDFVEHKVQGDGNCQFRALSDQLYNTPDHHKFVRRKVVNQLKSHPEIYEAYVPMEFSEYLEKMSRSGEWGDHVTLQAAADSYGVRIFVMTSFKDTCCIEILPSFEKPKGVIFISFWAEVHYNSIYPQGDDLHAKFVEAVNLLGLHDAVPQKIVGLMNVDGITSKHVASHLQKYRLGNKNVAHKVPSTLAQQPTQSQYINIHPSSLLLHNKKCVDKVPSTLIQPTQSQNIHNNLLNIHPSYKFPVNQTSTLLLPNKMPLHQLNMSGIAPSPPSSTFPIYHQTSTFPTQSQNIINNSFNIHPSYNFPVNQTSTLLLPNKMPLHQSHPQVYSPSGLNMSGRSPTQFHNIIHPPPSTFPIYHQTSTLFQPLLNQSTSPLGFATSFDFHNAGTFVGTASSKSTSISDYDWYHKYMKKEPQLLQLPNNCFPILESDNTSQMNNNSQKTHNVVEPFIVGSASSLEEKNTNIWCDDNSFIDFPVEETNPKTLEDIANMSRCIEEEDLTNFICQIKLQW